MSRPTAQFYEFDSFRVDVAGHTLLHNGKPVALTPKVFDLLVTLIRQRDRAVSKEELMNTLWPDVAVEENNLSVNISALRRALGSSANSIETLPRYGYRFVAQVREGNAANAGPPAETGATPKSIAVLPFKALSPDGSDAHLGLGMTDTLITRLSNLSQVIVRPTSAVLRYAAAEQDPVAAGRELNVEAVLEGSLRRAGERIRVTVQLVSVAEQRPLWASKFDEHFTDIFAVEDSISERVAAALTLQLSAAERRLLTKRPTTNAEAYQLCLKGRYLFSHQTEEGVRRAIEYYQRALEQDSGYALAYSWLADAYCWLSHFYVPPKEAMPKASVAALRALELDETLAEAHTARALVQLWYEWDFPAAEREFKRALTLNPNYAVARLWYSFLLTALGRFDEGTREATLALTMEPLSNFINSGAGFPFFHARHYDHALEQASKMIELEPNSWVGHWLLGEVNLALGKFAEAIAALQKAVAMSAGGAEMVALLGYAYAAAGECGQARRVLADLQESSARRYVSPYYIAAIYTGLGETERAFECLEQAYEDRSEWLVWAKVEPRLDVLRADPRFAELLRRVGLAR
jgi:TolB-like protein/Flp pilus assembly protein TadD